MQGNKNVSSQNTPLCIKWIFPTCHSENGSAAPAPGRWDSWIAIAIHMWHMSKSTVTNGHTVLTIKHAHYIWTTVKYLQTYDNQISQHGCNFLFCVSVNKSCTLNFVVRNKTDVDHSLSKVLRRQLSEEFLPSLFQTPVPHLFCILASSQMSSTIIWQGLTAHGTMWMCVRKHVCSVEWIRVHRSFPEFSVLCKTKGRPLKEALAESTKTGNGKFSAKARHVPWIHPQSPKNLCWLYLQHTNISIITPYKPININLKWLSWQKTKFQGRCEVRWWCNSSLPFLGLQLFKDLVCHRYQTITFLLCDQQSRALSLTLEAVKK